MHEDRRAVPYRKTVLSGNRFFLYFYTCTNARIPTCPAKNTRHECPNDHYARITLLGQTFADYRHLQPGRLSAPHTEQPHQPKPRFRTVRDHRGQQQLDGPHCGSMPLLCRSSAGTQLYDGNRNPPGTFPCPQLRNKPRERGLFRHHRRR